MTEAPVPDLLAAARVGFAGLKVSPVLQERALEHLERWLREPPFAAYRYQLRALIARERWDLLLDSFYQVLPFGTGGRRGPVGIGPNRFNPWTLATSVQGHAAWLRNKYGERQLTVVLAWDVRQFRDLGGHLVPGEPNPVLDLSSRAFADIAAEVYAAAGVLVYLSEPGRTLSTPELSFAIRHLGADGGLNISASHNPPDDNGSKFYNRSGSQDIPPDDEDMANEVERVAHIERLPLDRARKVGLVRELGPEVHEAYIAANLSTALRPDARSAKVAFSGLHGLGRDTVVPVLERAGFQVVVEPSQSTLDGAFPNVPFRAPNPEVRRSLDAVIAFGEQQGADIALATDPDADRIGLAVRHPGPGAPGTWRFVNGNEIAALICATTLRHGHFPRPLVLTTDVTSLLLTRVAQALGARVKGDLLVGFKYIGDALNQIEAHGQFAGIDATLSDFALGAEESHGVLVTPAMRDKDAAGGALRLAEMASLEKEQGKTLVDALEALWRQVGYVHNELVSTLMRGAEGRARIRAIQQSLREHPPTTIGGRAVTAFHDRQDPSGPLGPIRSETDRASRDVLVFWLGDDARIVLRPSGTEPKNKVYVEVAGPPGEPDIAALAGRARDLASAFTLEMLHRVGLSLPVWALEIHDLVSVEHKLHFTQEVLPALIIHLEDGDPNAGRWLDTQIAAYGRDARGLVAPALAAYLRELPDRPPWAGAVEALISGG